LKIGQHFAALEANVQWYFFRARNACSSG